MQIGNPYIQYMYSYPHKTAYGALKGVDLAAYMDRLAGQKNSLYFHIPFCQSKCGYCNLFSLAGKPELVMREYVDAMECQAQQISSVLPSGVEFSDLTLGGGTPLILPEELLKRVFGMAEKYFGFRGGEYPVVAETAPDQTTREKLELLKAYGVTRISIGVQSFQEAELKRLCRMHTVESARRALALIKQTGFSCVNIDLMYGIPEQSRESLLNSVEQALFYEPEELFVYPLYVKPGTGLYHQGVRPSPDTYELYQCLLGRLKKEGYQPYSMRRFVKKRRENGQELEPESSLCGFGNTISVGCGGRSYVGNLHFCTPYAVEQAHCTSIVKKYIEKKDHLQVEYGFLLSKEEERRRYVIRHILFGRGILRADYRQHFGGEAEQDFSQIADWLRQGYAFLSQEYIALTEKGIALSDYLGPQLISQEVREKMRKWGEQGWNRRSSGTIEGV